MKTKITIELDADLLHQLRVLAAEETTSISSMLESHLEEEVFKRSVSRHARMRATARLRKGMHLQWVRPDSRDKLHER